MPVWKMVNVIYICTPSIAGGELMYLYLKGLDAFYFHSTGQADENKMEKHHKQTACGTSQY